MHDEALNPTPSAYAYPLLIKHLLHTPLAHAPNQEIVYRGQKRLTYRALGERIARLGANDVPFERLDSNETRSRHAEEVVRFHDPFGMTIELARGLATTPRTFVSELVPEGFVTGELGLGHVLVLVTTMEAELRFYCDILGFSVSDMGRAPWGDAPEVEVAFLWSTPRHHSLALALVPEPIPRHLGHFFLQASNVDAVGGAYTRAKNNGVAIAHGLGRHTDGVFSFYGVTPSGFEYEIGTDGYLVDETWTSHLLTSFNIWGHRPE